MAGRTKPDRQAQADDRFDKPTKRRLRVFAFDPAASVQLETAVINDAVIELPWEAPWESEVSLGPCNDYLEVIDYDPACRTFYEPLDLNARWLLAQDGLPPAEGNPQFHQQMVFAVAMKTIRTFERALGRPVFWTIPEDDPRVLAKKSGNPAPDYPPFIKRLRIFPHAMREANAYYSPAKGALLFGYFKAPPRFAGDQGEWVFTCLSQDIVAHETAHAILHGMRRRSVEPANPDSLAFHEAFADIIALLQHFTMANVVRHELGRNGGKLRSVNLLTGLASQFGHATGRGGALRQALQTLSEEQQARDNGKPIPTRTIRDAREPHERGQFLVTAVFDAFVTIYERRTSDLFAMAGCRPGDDRLPEQMVTRLADEADGIARSVLNMCVRGLDYLPPCDANFGDYLRAVITADTDIVPDDPLKYRVAFAESFRKREIPVPGCISYAPDSLCWEPPELDGFNTNPDEMRDTLFSDALRGLTLFARVNGMSAPKLATDVADPRYFTRASALADYIADSNSTYASAAGERPNLRDESMRVVMSNQLALHTWLIKPADAVSTERMWEDLLGLRTLPLGAPKADDANAGQTGEAGPTRGKRPNLALKSISATRLVVESDPKLPYSTIWADAIDYKPGDTLLLPRLEVHTVRISRRVGPDGNELFQMIAQVTQRRRGYFDVDTQKLVDEGGPDALPDDRKRNEPDFWFRGGATIIVDLRDGRPRRIVRQRIDNDTRLAAQRAFILGDDVALAMASVAVDVENAAKAAGEARGAGRAVAGDCPAAVTKLEGEPFAFMHGESR